MRQLPDDDKFDEFVRRHAQDYRADDSVPADEMWARIEKDVADAIDPSPRLHSPRRVWVYAAAGLAAALLIGIGIGRWSSARTPATAPLDRVAATTQNDSARRVTHLRATAYDHLGETEIFLTAVRADLRAGRTESDRGQRSRELLARTRLLLSRREAQPPEVMRLLEDVELLLAEIAAVPDTGRAKSAETQLLKDALSRDDVIPRIRTALPTPSGGT